MGASLAKMEAPLLDAQLPAAAQQAGTVRFVFLSFFLSHEVKSFFLIGALLSLFVSLVVVVDDVR